MGENSRAHHAGVSGCGGVNVGVNLLWLVPGGVGGSEEYITRQIGAMVEAGQDRITLFVLPGFASAHPGLASNCELVVAPVRGHRRALRVATEVIWLNRQFRRRRFDVVHHAGGTVPPGSRGPIVVTVHDIQYLVFPATFSRLKLQYLRRAVPAAVRRASIVVTPSQFVADTVGAALGVPEERIVVALNAPPPAREVPTESDDLRRTYGLPGRVVLYPAITYRHKNHEVLLTAMKPLLAAYPTMRLVLPGGQGPVEADVIGLASRLGIASQVVRPGRIPAADLAGLYGLADVTAFPSRYEGFGLPVLEAMAAGCPVVAARSTALPEAVDSAGLLVDPDDVAGWTQSIHQVLFRAGVSDELRGRGYRRAAQFTAAGSAERLRTAYTLATTLVI